MSNVVSYVDVAVEDGQDGCRTKKKYGVGN